MKYEAILKELSAQNPSLIKDAAALDCETALGLVEDFEFPADIEAWLVSMLITSKRIANNGFEFDQQVVITGKTTQGYWSPWLCWEKRDHIIYISMTGGAFDETSAYFVEVEGRLCGTLGSVWYYRVLDYDRTQDYSLDFIQHVLADPQSAEARWAMRPGFPPRMVATSIKEFFSRWLASGLPETAVGK